MNEERDKSIRKKIVAWAERAQIALKQGQDDVVEASLEIVSMYEELTQNDSSEQEVLGKANLLRKRIESTEQHRTMSVEHGLGNEAIDATYEIKELENELVKLMQAWKVARSSGGELA